MHTAGVVALAASALTAQALLLPPGVASVDPKGNRLPDWTIDPTSQSIKLPCSDCVFPTKQEERVESTEGDDFVWIQGGANSVVLDFSVVDDGKSLTVNGLPIFPPTSSPEKGPSVKQVASSASMVDIKSEAARTTTLDVAEDHLFINEEVRSPSGDAIIRVTYQIDALEHQRVSVDGAEVILNMDAAGGLQILAVSPVPRVGSIFESLPMHPHAPHRGGEPAPVKDCGMLPALMCQWKNAAESKFNDVKAGMPKKLGGCHGKKGGKKGGKDGAKKLPGHIKPHIHWEGENGESGRKLPGHIKPHLKWEGAEADKPKGFHGRPQGEVAARPHRHHGQGHRHGHHSHFLHRLIKGFVMVLIPVMAGITMGLTVSLLGLLVGRLISFAWIKFGRGGKRGYASVGQDDDQSEVAEKGQIVLEESTEPLPVYEEAPAYEESERK